MAVEDRDLETAGGRSNDEIAAHGQDQRLPGSKASGGLRSIPAFANEKGDSLATRFWKRRLLFAGVGAGASFIALVIAAILALLPLKLEFLMKSFEQKFGTATQSALEKRVEKATFYYLVRRAQGKNFTGCTGVTGGKICDPLITSGSIWKDTFKNWQVSKFEQRLARDQGIRLSVFTNQNGVRRVAVHTGRGGDFNFDEADFEANRDVFKDHKAARVFFRDAVKQQTGWKGVFFRRFYRDLLRTKYGVKKWRIFEKQRDAVNDKVSAARTRLYNYGIENVLRPHVSESLADDIKCILEGCKKGDLNRDVSPMGIDDRNAASAPGLLPARTACELAGRPPADCAPGDLPPGDPNNPQNNNNERNKGKSEVRKLVNATIRLSVQGLAGEAAGKKVQEIIEKQLFEQITGKLAGGLGTMELISTLDKALWKDTIGQVIEARKKAQYVALFSMYRTANDEFKNGHMTTGEVDAINSQLDGAEKSRLYSFDFNLPRYDANNKVIPEAAAAAAQTPDCTDGSYLKDTEVLCAYKKVSHQTGSSIAYQNSPVGQAIHTAVGVYDATLGPLVKFAFSVIGDIVGPFAKAVFGIPGIKEAFGSVTNLIGKFLLQALPTVATGLDSGPDLYEGIRIGSDVSYNDVAHFSLGGQKLTPQDQVAIAAEMDSQQNIRESHKSLLARLTNLDNLNSAGSRFMAGLPFTRQTAAAQIAAAALNPLRSLASINPFALAFAANTGDPAAVVKYGYPLSDPALDRSPADPYYSAENCKKVEEEWAKKTAEDPDGDNGTNPCRLEFVAAESANATSTTADDGGIGTPQGAAPCVGQSNNQSLNTGDNIYVLGDSLAKGADAAGLGGKLQGKGFGNVFIDASTGRSITGGGSDGNRLSGLKAVDYDAQKIRSAGAVVIELGTNPGGGVPGGFRDDVGTLVNKIRSINGSAKIYWVNIVSTVSANQYDRRNQIISDAASANNFTVINALDLVKLPPNALHPASYQEYVKAIAAALGSDISNGGCGASAGGGTVTGSSKQLAQVILDNNKIGKSGRAVMSDLQNAAVGKPAYSNVYLDNSLLEILATLGQSHSYSISSITGQGSGHSNGSNHYIGGAADLNPSINGETITYDTASPKIFNFIVEAAKLMPQSKDCEIGTPYSDPTKNKEIAKYAPGGCYVFFDKGNGAHVHLAAPE